jgi:hypothetical protein
MMVDCRSIKGRWSLGIDTERHAVTIIGAAKKLRALQIPIHAPSPAVLSSVAQLVGSTLTHLNVGLRSNQPASFLALGDLIHLRELRVECEAFGDGPLPASEELDTMRAWHFPELQLLDLHVDSVPEEHQDAFLAFLARHRFTALRDFRITLCRDVQGMFSEPLERFLVPHPDLRSVTLGGGAADSEVLLYVLPFINAARLHIASLNTDAVWVEVISPEVRELVIGIDVADTPPEELFEALEDDSGVRRGLRQLRLQSHDLNVHGPFEWTELSEMDDSLESLGLYVRHAFRLKKLGIVMVDETGKTLGTESVEVSFKYLSTFGGPNGYLRQVISPTLSRWGSNVRSEDQFRGE